MTNWNRSKIMLVGQGRAGKTALARSMMGEPFRETPSTIGGELFEREIREGSVKGGKLAEHKRPKKELEWMIAKTGMRQSALASDTKDNMNHVDNDAFPTTNRNYKPVLASVLGGSGFKNDNPELCSVEETVNCVNANINKVRVKKIESTDVNTDLLYKCFTDNLSRGNHMTKLTVSLCDFGGQDVFNALHAFFMTRCGVYMLVFDMELFLSKDEKDRESCQQNVKFWMNSIAMHTYDEKTGKTAPVALVGTRKDKISKAKDHERISDELKRLFVTHRIWSSLIEYKSEKNGMFSSSTTNSCLCFFPVNNTHKGYSEWLFKDSALQQLLEKAEGKMMESEEVNREIPMVWIKVFDEIREKQKEEQRNFLFYLDIEEIGGKNGVPANVVPQLLTYFCEMGVLIWIEEPGLKEIVILDPIDYFVKPVTRIICKHLASKKDPYAIKHELPVHMECKEESHDDWELMLEYGLVKDKLARKLLRSGNRGDEITEDQVEMIMLLMEKYGLMIPIVHEEDKINEAEQDLMYFVPSLVPEEPDLIVVSESNNDERKLVARLHQRRVSLCRFRSSSSVFLMFSLPSSKGFQLFSSNEVEMNGSLPNGLFDRFMARILSNLPDLIVKSSGTRFIAFRDMMRIDCHGKLIRFTNHFHQNMIKIEIEEGSSISDLRELVEEWLEEVKKLIRECYKCLEVRVLIPVDCEDVKEAFISADLMNENDPDPEYISEDGSCRLTRTNFNKLHLIWSAVSQIPPLPLPQQPLLHPTTPRHIMLSYCWGYKKDHVIALEGKLKQLGYDIWRDENGSSIVPPLTGDTDEIMARAVENSSLIIIFVCKAYFPSDSCKKEAQYCSQKRKPLLFVMLDENYHTLSSPETVSGWLGLLIGTQLWYPLWNLDQLESSSSAISKTIGNISLLSQNQQLLAVAPPTTLP
jgi:GTPase SAR1 family protein